MILVSVENYSDPPETLNKYIGNFACVMLYYVQNNVLVLFNILDIFWKTTDNYTFIRQADIYLCAEPSTRACVRVFLYFKGKQSQNFQYVGMIDFCIGKLLMPSLLIYSY